LDGTIPTEMGLLTNLDELLLQNNTFINANGRAVPDALCSALFVTEPIVRDFELDNVAGDDKITNKDECDAARFAS